MGASSFGRRGSSRWRRRRCGALGSIAWFVAASPAAAAPSASAELSALLSQQLLPVEAADADEPVRLPSEELLSERLGYDNRLRIELRSLEIGPALLTTQARLGVELPLEPLSRGEIAGARDAGTWLGVRAPLGSAWSLGLLGFPLDTDYRRIGFLHALDWGGSDVGRRQSAFLGQRGTVPGLELWLASPRIRFHVGLRWATADAALSRARRLWGVMGGGGLRLGASWGVDFGLGRFERALSGGRPASPLAGATLRLVWRRGVDEPEQSLEPLRPAPFNQDPWVLEAEQGQGSAVALEGVAVTTRRPSSERHEAERSLAPGLALYGSWRGERGALQAGLSLRSFEFVMHDAVGWDERAAWADARMQPELAAWVSASLTLWRGGLVPSVTLGVQAPAALSTPGVLEGLQQVLVVRQDRTLELLPLGSERLPALGVRLAVRRQLSTDMALLAMVTYVRDPNRVRLQPSASGPRREFARPDQGGLALGLRWRL